LELIWNFKSCPQAFWQAQIKYEGFFAKMKLYRTVFTVLGLVSLLACAGTQSGGTGTKTDTVQITPQRLKDIVGIEWQLKKGKLVLISSNQSILLEFEKN
jgi:hypothetical protein